MPDLASLLAEDEFLQDALRKALERQNAPSAAAGMRTPGGALLGGIADIIRTGKASASAEGAGTRLQALRAEQAKARREALGRMGALPEGAGDDLDSMQRAATARRALAAQYAGSGDPVLAPYAPRLMGEANDIGGRFTQAVRDARASADRATDDKRADRALALQEQKAKADKPPRFQIVVGADGQQYYVDPHNPQAAATPITGPDGKPMMKPKATRAMSSPERDTLQNEAEQVRALGDLSGRFKDDFAGKGVLGGALTWANQTLGSMGSEGMQQDAAFWADWQKFIELPQRNKMFGASLTPTEKASWANAQNVRPGADPALVRRTLSELHGILGRRLTGRAEGLKAEGVQPEAVEALVREAGRVTPQGGVAPAGTVRVRDRDGKIYEIQRADLAEAQADGAVEIP